MSAAPSPAAFDPASITWQTMGRYPGVGYHLLNVDVEHRVIDMLFRFDPNVKCFYHRHHQPSSTLVIQGEQHIWEPEDPSPGTDRRDGPHAHRVRRAGERGATNEVETHIEGGGPDGCVIYMNVRARDDLIYSILNDDLTTRVDVTLADFAASLEQQRRAA
ncbi:MAG: cupin domain-containing protein [Gammaproteobacteria bacterium]